MKSTPISKNLNWLQVYVQHYNGDIVIEDKDGDGFSFFTGALIHKIEAEEPK